MHSDELHVKVCSGERDMGEDEQHMGQDVTL